MASGKRKKSKERMEAEWDLGRSMVQNSKMHNKS